MSLGVASLAVTDAPRVAADFVGWLVARHAWLAPILEEHLRDNHGELLPHVLFGDVTRYAADLARRASDDPSAEGDLRRLLDDLNAAMLPPGDDDDPVDNLIWVSFVENAQGVPGDSEEALRDRLRSFPNLARALSYYE
jgi:hypothetical protein